MADLETATSDCGHCPLGDAIVVVATATKPDGEGIIREEQRLCSTCAVELVGGVLGALVREDDGSQPA